MLSGTRQKHIADVPDRPRGIQALGTDVHAVLDTVATEHTEGVIESGESLVGRGIACVRQEPVGL